MSWTLGSRASRLPIARASLATRSSLPRWARFASLAAGAFVAAAPTGTAAPNLMIGISDDQMIWTPTPTALLRNTSDLGIGAIRVTLRWSASGDPAAGDAGALARLSLVSASGTRVVVAAFGRSSEAPRDVNGRSRYCGYLASIARRAPQLRDFVVWNEPNSAAFWQPQSGAALAYEQLLAECWDAVHSVAPDANVIAASAPRGTTRADAWYRAIGAAYRASGRSRPIFDTIGHNVYPLTDREDPGARHPASQTTSQGDYARLVGVLLSAFGGTSQTVPSARNPSIWYMEDGFQSEVQMTKGYTGIENDLGVLDPDEHARQVTRAIRLAYCQPAVGAFFNFQLLDERNLAGWQSGLAYADGTKKPAYAAFKAAALAVQSRSLACTGGS
jgi:hypothetical protein